jgi:hypothetical protein
VGVDAGVGFLADRLERASGPNGSRVLLFSGTKQGLKGRIVLLK